MLDQESWWCITMFIFGWFHICVCIIFKFQRLFGRKCRETIEWNLIWCNYLRRIMNLCDIFLWFLRLRKIGHSTVGQITSVWRNLYCAIGFWKISEMIISILVGICYRGIYSIITDLIVSLQGSGLAEQWWLINYLIAHILVLRVHVCGWKLTFLSSTYTCMGFCLQMLHLCA